MTSILDGLVNDVLEYLGEHTANSRDDPSLLNNAQDAEPSSQISAFFNLEFLYNTLLVFAFWHLNVLAVIVIAVVVLILTLTVVSCKRRRCNAVKKHIVVRSSSSKQTSVRKISSKVEPPARAESQHVQLDTSNACNYKAAELTLHKEVRKVNYPTPECQPSEVDQTVIPLPEPPTRTVELSDELIPRIKERTVRRRHREPHGKLKAQFPKTEMPRKAQHCVHYDAEIQKMELSLGDRHYNISSPRHKNAPTLATSHRHRANRNLAEDAKTRWNGGSNVRRTTLTRRRHPLSSTQEPVSTNSAKTKDQDKSWHRNTSGLVRMPLMMKSSSPSPSIRKPSLRQYPQYPQQSVGRRFRDTGAAERKLTKRSNVLILNHDVTSDPRRYTVMTQNGKDSYKMKIDWPICPKFTETVRGSSKPKSPKKVKRSAMSKSKKASGHNRRKIRRRHKDKSKEKFKSTLTKDTEDTQDSDDDEPGDHVLHFPEPCRAIRLPSSVWQAPKVSSHAENFTIKRTVTPVLSSLFGQGAFRTCWPQGTQSPCLEDDEGHDNENTGRHNTIFLGPKAQDSNNETTETVNSTRMNNNIIWDKATWDNTCFTRRVLATDAEKGSGFLIESVLVPERNTCRFPANERKEQFHETQVFKNICVQSTHNAEKKFSCEREGIEDCYNSFKIENSLQFIASSCRDDHNKDLNKSNKQQYVPLQPQKNESTAAGVVRNTTMRSLKLTNKGSSQTSGARACRQIPPTQCSRLYSSEQSKYNETTPYAGEAHAEVKCFQNRTDCKSRRDDIVQQDNECQHQLPPASYCSTDTQKVAGMNNTTSERRTKSQRQNEQTKTSSVVPSVPMAGAALRFTGKPSESQGSHTVWRATSLSKDGNVFRVTRNNNLPLLHHPNHSLTLHESTKARAKPNIVEDISSTAMDFQKESEDSSSCWCRDTKTGASFPCHTTSYNIFGPDSSRLTVTPKLYPSGYPINKHNQVTREEMDIEKDKLHWDVGQPRSGKQTWGYTNLSSSIASRIQQPATKVQAFQATQKVSSGQRPLLTLDKSNSLVSSTFNDISDAESGSANRKEQKEHKKTIRKLSSTTFDNVSTSAGQSAENGFGYDCHKDKHNLPDVKKRSISEEQTGRHRWKVKEHTSSKIPTGKLNIFRSHTVKKTKSLISLRNMLQELTSQVRGNQHGSHCRRSPRARKPSVKAVMYFKPVMRFRKPSLNYEQRRNDYREQTQYCPLFQSNRSVNKFETSDSYETNEDYVNCLRLKRIKAHRHEPYNKRASTSSCSVSEQHKPPYWTRNKNNCSPSRTGRYVLGPLVDKHVFEDTKHSLAENSSQTSASTVTPLQEFQRIQKHGHENRTGRFTAQQSLKRHLNIDHRTQKHCSHTRPEELKPDTDSVFKISTTIKATDSDISFADEVPPDPADCGLKFGWNKSKERLARGNAHADQIPEDKEKLVLGQSLFTDRKVTDKPTASCLGQTTGDSSQGGKSCRRSVIRRQPIVSSTRQTDARYLITRPSESGCPVQGQSFKPTEVETATRCMHSEQGPMRRAARERPIGHTQEYTAPGLPGARYTSTELRNIGQSVLRHRFINTEHMIAGNTGLGHTPSRYTTTEKQRSRGADFQPTSTKDTTTETSDIQHQDLGYEIAQRTAVGTKHTVHTNLDDTTTNTTTATPSVSHPDRGQAAKGSTPADTKVMGRISLGYTATRHTNAEPITAAENLAPRFVFTKQDETTNGEDCHNYYTSCSDNIQQDSTSTKEQSTDMLGSALSQEHTAGTSTEVPKPDKTYNTNIECSSAVDKSISAEQIDSISSKSKTAARTKISRIQYNRINVIKNQAGHIRLRGVRGQQSLRNVLSGDIENPPRDRLKIKDKSKSADNMLRNGGRASRMVRTVPSTQSHMTQTDSRMNVHVGVQTSPYLQISPRKASLKCSIKKCVVNTRLLRHKGKQEEHILSRYRHVRKLSRDNAAETSLGSSVSLSLRSSKMQSLEQATDRCMEHSHFAELTNTEQNTDSPNTNKKTTLQVDDNQQSDKTRNLYPKREHPYLLGQKETKQKQLIPDNPDNVSQHDSQNGSCPNTEISHAKSNRDVHSTEAEVRKQGPDKPGSDKRGKSTSIRKMLSEKYCGETRNCPDHSKQVNSEHLVRGDCCETKQVQLSCSGEAEKQKCGSTVLAQKVSKRLGKPEEKLEETQVASTWSSRADTVEQTDSNSMSSRFSDLKKLCVIRPVWKNAKVEEIDRRVSRALRLREDLKQNASSGEQARSLIASYFENSSATATVTNTGWVNPENSSSGISDLASTSKSAFQTLTAEASQFHDAGSDNTVCHTGDHTRDPSRRNSSSESEQTAQDEAEATFPLDSAAAESVANRTHPGWSSTDFRTSSGKAPNQTGRKRLSQNETHGSRVAHSASVHELLVSEIVRESDRPPSGQSDRPPSGEVSSHPSNNSIGNSTQQAGRRNKNSPPTKISKVENVSTSTPRLVDALVQKLPQVPLSSFVEWFIETSDPNNFVSSDLSGSSSDNSQSMSACFGPLPTSSANDHASSVVHSKTKDISHNVDLKRTLGATSSRKTQMEEIKKHNQNDHYKKAENTKSKYSKRDTTSDTWTSIHTQSFASNVPCTPSSTSYALSCSSEGVDKESVLERERRTLKKEPAISGDDEKSTGVLKFASKSSLNSKPSSKAVKGVCSKFSYSRRSSDSLSFRKGSTKHTKGQKYDYTRQSTFPARRHSNAGIEDMIASDKAGEQSSSVTKWGAQSERGSYRGTNTQADLPHLKGDYVSHSTETLPRQDASSSRVEQKGETCSTKQCEQAARHDLEMTEYQDHKAGSRQDSESKPTLKYATPGFVEDRQDRSSLPKDATEKSRCAPGIRHILMKLRQTADAEEPATGRSDRMKITLRKSSEVTGIIAKFQNK